MHLDEFRRAENPVTESVIGSAIAVHRSLGPGLLESVYEEALAVELGLRRIAFERQVPIPLFYKEHRIAELKLDLVVAREIVVELKTVETLAPIHTAQLLTYLRASDLRLGLLINFKVPRLVEGIRRVVL